MSLGLNHVLKENNTTSKNNNSDFWWIFVRLDFNEMLSFQSINSLETFSKFCICILNF